jgi:hypothetical protein
MPRVHKYETDPERKWMSAPIACAGEAKGVVVVACADGNGAQGLNFLDKAAERIGYLLNVCSNDHMLASKLELPKVEAGPIQD